MNVRIERLNDTGDGVGNYSGKIIFVPKTVFGDLVDVYDYLEEISEYAQIFIKKFSLFNFSDNQNENSLDLDKKFYYFNDK